MTPAHPHRRHNSQRSRKQKRIEAARRKRQADRLHQNNTQPAPKPAGFFALVRYILERWFK